MVLAVLISRNGRIQRSMAKKKKRSLYIAIAKLWRAGSQNLKSRSRAIHHLSSVV